MVRRIASVVAGAAFVANVFAAQSWEQPKNVIVMIPDGCGPSIVTLSRWYKGEDLAVDKMTAGVVKTHMANSVVTGSAAASTAFACGFKTTVRYLGIGPRSEDVLSTYEWPYGDQRIENRPLASVLEAARLQGKSVGLISTSRVTHATPAGYACHIQDRGWDNDIIEHMVYQGLDVCFGGGKRHLLPKSMGGKRTDGENLLDTLLAKGYQFVETKSELASLTSGKAWGLFAMSHMDADMDRATYNPDEPSIKEMTEKAIELLSQNPNGFFLMVEGSQVDWAGHNNDPIWMITDFLAFDDAVKSACDFADSNEETAIIGFPDHNCGGMDIGNYTCEYTNVTMSELLDPFKNMKVTASSVVGEMAGDYSDANMIATIQTWWGLTITAEDAQAIRDKANTNAGPIYTPIGMSYALAEYISEKYTQIGWVSHGHNGEDVPFWTYGKGLSGRKNTLDNTQLADYVFRTLNVNKYTVNGRLFVDLSKAAPSYSIDTSDPENPVAVIEFAGGAATARLPISKNCMSVTTADGTDTYELEGLVVHVPATDKVWVPKQAVEIAKTYY